MQSAKQTTSVREEEILRELRLSGGSCRIRYLAEQLSVSYETIRRNVKNLEDLEIVRKVHGGVHLINDIYEPPLQNRMATQAGIKEQLAQAVAENIKDGDSIFLDIGSTTAFVALALKPRKNLLVVTNSVSVAQTLATRNNNRVILAGGELRAHDGGAFGAEALNLVCQYHVQFAIFSVGAVNSNHGFMLHDLAEANLAREAIKNAQVRIVVADSEKFERRAPVSIGSPKEIDLFYSDSQPSGAIRKMLEINDIDFFLVSKPNL